MFFSCDSGHGDPVCRDCDREVMCSSAVTVVMGTLSVGLTSITEICSITVASLV